VLGPPAEPATPAQDGRRHAACRRSRPRNFVSRGKRRAASVFARGCLSQLNCLTVRRTSIFAVARFPHPPRQRPHRPCPHWAAERHRCRPFCSLTPTISTPRSVLHPASAHPVASPAPGRCCHEEVTRNRIEPPGCESYCAAQAVTAFRSASTRNGFVSVPQIGLFTQGTKTIVRANT